MDNLTEIWASVLRYLPNLLAAVAILIVGWLVSLIVAALVRAALRRTTIDNRLAEWVSGKKKGAEMQVERAAGRVVFYLLMLFVLVAFFQVLGLTVLTRPINELLSQVFVFLPRLAGAGILLLVAWLVAAALRILVVGGLSRLKLEERVGTEAALDEMRVPLSKTLGEVVYWLVFLLFLPAVLGALALEGLLQPVQGMVDEVLAYLPNLGTAAVILVVGWFVARVVQRIVANLLAAVGTDRLSERIGVGAALGEQRLSNVLALVVYVLVLVPVLISALGALGLDGVTEPASNMLSSLLAALPAIFAAALVLTVSYVVARVVTGLVSGLLHGVGFDTLVVRLGIGKASTEGARAPSSVVGYLALVAIMLFATIEAFSLMGFVTLADLFAQLAMFGGRSLMAVVVFGAGLYLASLAAGAIERSTVKQARTLATVARFAILILAAAMALQQIGLADEIISLAFGLSLGAVAVAAAVAFGLGGRELAAQQLEDWHRAARGEVER